MKLSLAVQTPEIEIKLPVALLSGSFEERLRRAADLGYDGVELMTSDPNKLDAHKIRTQLKSLRLDVSAIGSGAVFIAEKLSLLAADPETSHRAIQRLIELIEFAAILEAPYVTVGGFRGRAAWISHGNGRSQLIDILRKAADHAYKKGVRVVLEPLNRYESDIINNAAEGLFLLEEVNHNSLGIVLDTFHMNIEEPSFVSSIEKVMSAQRLWHVHIGDSNRFPPGQGHINFPEIVAALRNMGYDGYLSAELLPFPDENQAAKKTIEFMRRLIPKGQN